MQIHESEGLGGTYNGGFILDLYERSGHASTRLSYTVMSPKLISSDPSTMYPILFEALYHDLRRVS
jgi:hypothetical protein